MTSQPAALRVAIVGCGKVADDHAETIILHPGAEVVACCDLEPLMAEQLARRYDIPGHYSDLALMLAETKPDVVHVTTPPQSHVPIATQAIEAGCHVWVEKPLALHTDAVRELIAAAQAADRLITVGHSYWLDTPALDLRDIVASGALGDIVHVESWYGYDLSGAYGKAIMDSPENWVHGLPGKLFQNNIDHLLNKLLEFMPSDDIEVKADAFRRLERRDGDRRDDLLDELRFTLKDATGVTAYGTFTSSVKPAAQWIRVYGTKGSAEADFNLRTVELTPGIKLPTNLGRLLPSIGRIGAASKTAFTNATRFAKSEFHYFAGFRNLVDEFYDAIQTGGEPPIPYRDMVRISMVQDEIWEQIYS